MWGTFNKVEYPKSGDVLCFPILSHTTQVDIIDELLTPIQGTLATALQVAVKPGVSGDAEAQDNSSTRLASARNAHGCFME